MVRERGLAIATAAYWQQMPDWPRAMRAAIEALLAYFAAEPDLARVAMVEVLAAGGEALERRDEAVESFVSLFDPGYKPAPPVSPVAREAVPFGLYSLIHRHLGSGGEAATLPRLVPAATFFALAPFLGAERAAGIANEKASPPVRSAPATAPAGLAAG